MIIFQTFSNFPLYEDNYDDNHMKIMFLVVKFQNVNFLSQFTIKKIHFAKF